jgi:general secretion pathway protein N
MKTRIKRTLAWSALALGAYLVFLLAQFPAAQAWRLAEDDLAARLPALQVAAIDGSLWQGRIGTVAWQSKGLGQLEWRLSPWALLRQRADARLSLQNTEGYLQARMQAPLSSGELQLEGLQGRFPVQQASRFMAFLPVTVAGTLSLHIPELRFEPQQQSVNLHGQVIWHQAVISLTEPMPLGDLRADLSTDEQGRLHAQIRDSGGPLSIDATAQLERDGRYRLQGTVAAAEGASDALKQALGWLGKPNAQGRYALNFNGKI